ncbi:alpha/beta hydrolase [Streptomonospora sp. S1-112]|uniref:Alpha/beta hydrolase n=1 Tax=Streptomonospora mangrovi TaxID=2883123 RepID=A0A9X3SDK9_9ACTN|nr:alpha/beta hydrolase [Streptomonospora mangrovi]MDA0562755.1 alpha/beta hydrolase [Streptomonospora mangrovi]
MAVPVSAVPARPAAAEPALEWVPCEDIEAVEDGGPLECATLAVPLDRATGAGTAELALSRVPARKEPTGTLVVNPGGPGSPGRVWASRTAAGLPDRVRDHFDVIGFDPRGTGASTPAVACDPGHFAPVRPDTWPGSAEETDALVRRAADYAAACADNTGAALLENMTTRDSAADLEAIRAALGVERIDYLGYSYGTLLGGVYATLHPDRVRRLVLDSVVHPGRPWYASNLRQSRALDDAAHNFFAWTARHDAAYGLGSTGEAVAERYYAARAALAEKPAEDTVGPTELENSYLTAAYSSASWPRLARALADYAVGGDTAGLVAVHERYGEDAESDPGYGAYLATQCTDSRWPRNTDTWLTDGREVHAEAPFQGWNNIWYNMPCATWPAGHEPWFHVDGTRAADALLIQAEHDGPTPLEGAYAMRERFPGGRLVLEEEGVSHGVALGGNTCVDDAFAEYLLSGALPPAGGDPHAPDLTCPASPEPEPEPEAGAAEAAAEGADAPAEPAPAAEAGAAEAAPHAPRV